MAQFTIKDLSFTYPEADKEALACINLDIEKGEYIVLCGRSGCGKSTLLRQLKKSVAPHGKKEGSILFDGTDVEKLDQRTEVSKIGFVMQNPEDQIVTDKVWHELAFGLESLGMSQSEMRLKVSEMASFFGIEDWFYKNVAELSGGQKQLLNLASIMAMQPEVIILDEPTSQLDPIAAVDFLNVIKKINTEIGTTIIISEHRLEEVLPVADRVLVLDKGKIEKLGDVYSVGKALYEENSEMFEAMPTPMKVYFKTKKKDMDKFPITVREGRNYLTELKDDYKDISLEKYDEDDFVDVAIDVKEVHFKYSRDEKDVLRGTKLRIPKNVVYAILGGNGAGKTTLLGCMCGLNTPYSGKVMLDGKNIKKLKDKELFRNNIAMLPQDPKTLFVKNKVSEELSEMTKDKEKIDEVIKLTQIEEFLDRHPYDLSGGEMQKVALAKVLLCEPKILLMDEPTKGLDSFYKNIFADIIAKLKDKGLTIVLVSHDIEFCSKYADVCAMMFNGEITTSNNKQAFFANNAFYTTVAAKMSRNIIANAVTEEDILNA